MKNTISDRIWANTCLLLFYLRLFETKIRWITPFDLILLQRHTYSNRVKVLSTSFIRIFYVPLLLSFNIFRKLIHEIYDEEWTQWYEQINVQCKYFVSCKVQNVSSQQKLAATSASLFVYSDVHIANVLWVKFQVSRRNWWKHVNRISLLSSIVQPNLHKIYN